MVSSAHVYIKVTKLQQHDRYFICALFPDTLEGIFFGGVSIEEMVELETVRYLQGINKSWDFMLCTINTMEHYFLQEPLLEPALLLIYVFPVLFRAQQGPDHMLITHTEPDSDN